MDGGAVKLGRIGPALARRRHKARSELVNQLSRDSSIYIIPFTKVKAITAQYLKK